MLCVVHVYTCSYPTVSYASSTYTGNMYIYICTVSAIRGDWFQMFVGTSTIHKYLAVRFFNVYWCAWLCLHHPHFNYHTLGIDTASFSVMQHSLHCCCQLFVIHIQVLRPSSSSRATHFDLPKEFFNLSLEEIKREQKQRLLFVHFYCQFVAVLKCKSSRHNYVVYM